MTRSTGITAFDLFRQAVRAWRAAAAVAGALLAAGAWPAAPVIADSRHSPSVPPPRHAANAREVYGSLPLTFEPQRAETAPATFLVRGPGYRFSLTAAEVALGLDRP